MALVGEDGSEQAVIPPEGVEALEVEDLAEGLGATGQSPCHLAEVAGEAVPPQGVVEASSHPSCPTACTQRVEVSTRVPPKGPTTFPAGILEGARGLAASEAARDPSTK